MLEKLAQTELRYIEVEEALASPDVFSDNQRYTSLMKEYKNLTPIIEKYREYVKTKKANEEAYAMLDESLDSEMRELVNAELRETKAAMEQITEELKVLLIPRDPNDDKNVMIEIRSGAGGEEAALFAGVLYIM